jgi:hypothetical protein
MRDMDAVAVETELAAGDYLRLAIWASVRNVFVVIIYAINLAAAFAIIPGILSGRAKALTPFQLVFQGFILIGLPCILFASSRAAYRRLSPAQRSVRYLFTDDAIETVTGVASSTISWVAIQKVVETSAAFYVSPQKNIYQIVPKRAFKDSADLERFRELTKSKLGKKASVKKAGSTV